MRILIFCSLVLLSCNSDKLVKSPDKTCNEPCFTSHQSLRGKGACNEGIWICDTEGEIVECKGEGIPSSEVCDNTDNDCDGYIDEGIAGIPCSNICGSGYEVCKDGQMVCSSREPVPEVCNGTDSNCDGIIDNIEATSFEFCYTGAQDTASKGDCHPGFLSCKFGTKICLNEKTPTPEICDGIDSDCNGIVDDGFRKPLDVVVLFDISGSMYFYMSNIATATRMACDLHGGDADTRIATIKFGGAMYPYSNLVDNFQSVNDFKASIYNLLATGGGIEPSIDVCYDIGDFVNNPYGLTWRPDSQKRIIMFTDEYPQTLDTRQLTLQEANDQLRNNGISLFGFVEVYDSQYYASLSNGTRGGIFLIGSNVNSMASILDTILTPDCK